MISEIKEQIPEIKEQISKIKRDPLTERIIACAFKVHSELGPGFNERIYQQSLMIGFDKEGLRYQAEKGFGVSHQRKNVGMLKIDLLVNDEMIVEVKAVTGYLPKVFEAQVLAYLKVTSCKVGLLINFGNKSCQVRRLVLKSP